MVQSDCPCERMIFIKPIIIVDLEATCQENDSTYQKEIIEIGAIRVVDGIIRDEFDVFVKPLKNSTLSEYCKNLTHISQEDVDNGLSPAEAITKFYLWATNNYKDDVVYVSWGGFDQRELLREAQINHLNLVLINEIRRKHHNLKTIYAKVLGLKRQVGTLEALRREGLQFDGSNHRAIDDVKNINRIYLAQKTKINKYLERSLYL